MAGLERVDGLFETLAKEHSLSLQTTPQPLPRIVEDPSVSRYGIASSSYRVRGVHLSTTLRLAETRTLCLLIITEPHNVLAAVTAAPLINFCGLRGCSAEQSWSLHRHGGLSPATHCEPRLRMAEMLFETGRYAIAYEDLSILPTCI